MSRSALNALQSAFRSLIESRGRSALSALGILVGTTAIVLLISIAQGVRQDIAQEVEGLGVNLIIVLPARIEEDSFMAPGLMGISYLKESHAAEIQRIRGVRRVVPLIFVGSGLRLGKAASPSTLIIATKSDWFLMRPTVMREGRTLTPEDAHRPVCVVGSVAYKKLFQSGSALGKSITYNKHAYKIVGVTQDRENTNSMVSIGSFENVVYVPYEYLKESQPDVQIDRIIAQTAPDVEPKALVESIDKLLAPQLAHETYSVVTQQDLLKIVFKVMQVLTWLLVGLTSIALFVGGVGIMTIMLMSVGERTKEIGVRMAMGARRRDIFNQFLIEAIAIGVVGGAAGLTLSAIVAEVLRATSPLKPLITWQVVAISLAVDLGVGAIFGLIPAIRAAKRDPVVSLRNE